MSRSGARYRPATWRLGYNPNEEEDEELDTFEARKKAEAKARAAEKARVKDWPPRNQGLFPPSEVWPEADR
jgi:hypothetical protein